MPTFHPQLAALLRSHHGIVSSSQTRSLGVSRGELKAMISSTELSIVYEGVYRHARWLSALVTAYRQQRALSLSAGR